MLGTLFKHKISPNNDSPVLYYNSALKGKNGDWLFVFEKAKEIASWKMLLQGTPCSNIVPTLYQYCTFCGCQHVHSHVVGGDVWKWGEAKCLSSWRGWTATLGRLRIAALKVVCWAPWSIVIVSSIGVGSLIGWGGEWKSWQFIALHSSCHAC